MNAIVTTALLSDRDAIPANERFRKSCGPYLKNLNTESNRRRFLSEIDDVTTLRLLAFMERSDTPKGIRIALIGKLRYETQSFASTMRDVANHYDEAIALRAKYKSQQTYRNLMMILCGLDSYGDSLSAEDRSNLLAVTYSALSTNSPYTQREDVVKLSHQESAVRRVFIADREIVDLVLRYGDQREVIERLIVNGVFNAQQMEMVLTGVTPGAFISGAL